MAKRRSGALLFEKETGLQDYIETGISMNSAISQELLINVLYLIHHYMMGYDYSKH